MRAQDFDPITAQVPHGAVSGTRIYFDPVDLSQVFPDRTEDEAKREGKIGIRAMIVTPDGTVYHYMTMAGAHRRHGDFGDAIDAGERGQFADVSPEHRARVRSLLNELNPNGRAF